MKSKDNIIDEVNRINEEYISLLGGTLVDFDMEKRSCTYEFNIGKEYCHSIDVVQGGFVTAILDAAMSHAVVIPDYDFIGTLSLEI